MMRMPQLFMVLSVTASVSACVTLDSPTFSDDMGAIRGYDPVAYHTERMPVLGDPVYSLKYNNAVWHFASEENRRLFRNDPERYAPKYGGYCAYGMSKGFVVSTDPDAWTIKDDTLYLNYSPGVRETWSKDIPGYVEKADKNWHEKISQAVPK